LIFSALRLRFHSHYFSYAADTLAPLSLLQCLFSFAIFIFIFAFISFLRDTSFSYFHDISFIYFSCISFSLSCSCLHHISPTTPGIRQQTGSSFDILPRYFVSAHQIQRFSARALLADGYYFQLTRDYFSRSTFYSPAEGVHIYPQLMPLQRGEREMFFRFHHILIGFLSFAHPSAADFRSSFIFIIRK
jgi:hypothetical protein